MSLNRKIDNLSSKRNCSMRVPRERQLGRSHRLLGAGLDVSYLQPRWWLRAGAQSGKSNTGFWMWCTVLRAGGGWASPLASNCGQEFRWFSTHPKDPAKMTKARSHLIISSIILDWDVTALFSISEKPTTNFSRVSLGPTHYHLKNKCTLNISKNILTHKMLSILFHHSSWLRDHCFRYMSLIRAPGSVLRLAWVHH